ncbi:DUF3331 domain-containing protein [Burkholderia cenocepacia]|uniref:DUF3331 domain-containing protein n=1 Tax=Burkholderia cenocepacia TaxID=95486 RepID=UPI000F5A7D16|nr:DUF3331 domain-containing protein [Burkholderia cenocepacia]RQU02045.1 DUF3331 domain-containing protein [Burkholderia cenocepacia]RQU57972.1 DUF3331 domain-containing protein [Burkholderia cenocepacia]
MLAAPYPSSNAATQPSVVRILEMSDDHLLVRWVEPGKCHYGEQKWRLGVARHGGYCALSNRRIEPGDPAYRPVGRPRPVNHVAMIALKAIQSMQTLRERSIS